MIYQGHLSSNKRNRYTISQICKIHLHESFFLYMDMNYAFILRFQAAPNLTQNIVYNISISHMNCKYQTNISQRASLMLYFHKGCKFNHEYAKRKCPKVMFSKYS